MLPRKDEFVRVDARESPLVRRLLSFLSFGLLALTQPLAAQEQPLNWQAQVRKYCDASDWTSALRVVEAEMVRAPQDLDVKAWHARVLTWAGRLEEAERDYREILAIDRRDPD